MISTLFGVFVGKPTQTDIPEVVEQSLGASFCDFLYIFFLELGVAYKRHISL
jgi:hypothetical protein